MPNLTSQVKLSQREQIRFVFACLLGDCASVGLHNTVEASGPRGWGLPGSRDHRRENIPRAWWESSTTMWLWAPAGQGGGAQSPSSEISPEGRKKIAKCVIKRSCWPTLVVSILVFFAALVLPVAISAAVVDGELLGRCGAEAGQTLAQGRQTQSPLGTSGPP